MQCCGNKLQNRKAENEILNVIFSEQGNVERKKKQHFKTLH
jgi:hypothetical protein